MDWFFCIFIFLLGLAVGSFLNCIIFRIEKDESFFKGRSYCPHCKHKLSFWDLIPVLSFLILKGKCGHCRQKISLQYPLVELATGLLFLLIFNLQFSCLLPVGLLFNFFIVCFLIIIFVYDLKHYIIPDKIIYPAIGTAFLFRILDFGNWDFFGIWNLGFGILAAPLFFLAIIFASKGRWMGFGDVKLAVLMGLILGWPNILVALFLAFLIGAIIGVGLIVSGKKTLKSEVPFGPFLVAGTFIALFWGKGLVDWYLNFLIF